MKKANAVAKGERIINSTFNHGNNDFPHRHTQKWTKKCLWILENQAADD